MRLYFNDLSIHGQFATPEAFLSAFATLMQMRQLAQKHGRNLLHRHHLEQQPVTSELKLLHMVQQMERNKRAAVMSWLTKDGPFWDEVRQHDSDDYLECSNQTIATDSGLGEAAFSQIRGQASEVISIAPSDWLHTPIAVTWQSDSPQHVEIRNHWTLDTLETALQHAPASIHSWGALEVSASLRFPNLTFSPDCFAPLANQPFNMNVVERTMELLGVLSKLLACFTPQGQRNDEGHRLYQDHFTGDKAWFSDSSATEKRDFCDDMTFPHPTDGETKLFCPWHGKIKTPQYRIHFSWPISATEPLYVVYIGPKITKR